MQFLDDENTFEFYTYLPLQTDATCNGFQHMALLSNEDTLFKELNLVPNTKTKSNIINNNNQPNDFYNFLLHKLIKLFESKSNDGEVFDSKGKSKGSYERLSKFLLERSNVKNL